MPIHSYLYLVIRYLDKEKNTKPNKSNSLNEYSLKFRTGQNRQKLAIAMFNYKSLYN